MSSVARQKMALVVHPDLTILSRYQALLTKAEFSTVVARDIPTALLAITQHYFEVGIISSQLGESGDGWPLAGVFHLVFPKSFVSVIVPGADLLNLQTAINNGVQEIFEEERPPETVVSAVLAAAVPTSSEKSQRRSRLQ
jgi:DNA-binding NtrC family response regulator